MNDSYVLYLALFKMLKTFWLVPLVLIVGLAVLAVDERRERDESVDYYGY